MAENQRIHLDLETVHDKLPFQGVRYNYPFFPEQIDINIDTVKLVQD